MSSFENRFKKINETKNYLLDEINHYDLMREKYKKTCKYLDYVEHWLILTSTLLLVFHFLHLLHHFVLLQVLQRE